jgi:hypothetical protein
LPNLHNFIDARLNPNNPYATTHRNKLMRYIQHAQNSTAKNGAQNGIEQKNRRAASAVQRQNKSRLNHIHFSVRPRFVPILQMIGNKLHEVQTILYKLKFTRESVNWTLDNVNMLERVKQTLLNAQDIILFYPKEKYPKLYNSPKNNIVFIKSEREQIKDFFQPIIEQIYKERVNIVKAKGKNSNPEGVIAGYNIPYAILLNTADTQLLEVLYVLMK